MAGTADTDLETPGTAPTPEAPSLPLYLAGGVIALCGIFAANAALTRPDMGWMGRTVLLTGLGFVFSYGSRYLGVKTLVVDLGIGALMLLLLAGIVGGQIALEQFLPLGADNASLRLLATLVWMGTIWAWTLGGDTRVMLATVPAMATLGLAASVDLNDPVLVCFGVFILTVIFLLIHQNFLQNRARAVAEARTLVPARLLLAQFVQTGLCGLAVLLAGMVVIVPAQALFSHLSLAQAIRRLAAIRPPTATAGSVALRFSDDDNVQIGTGAAWSSSAEVVMHVTPSDGQEYYWRGRTYDLYTGAGWQSSLENIVEPALDEGDPNGGGQVKSYGVHPGLTPGDVDVAAAPPVTATFQVLGDTSQFYYAAGPRQVTLPAGPAQYNLGVRLCRDGRLDLGSGGSVHYTYQVASVPAPDVARPETQARLRRAGTEYPPDVKQLYLRADADGVTQPEDAAFFRQAVDEAVSPLPPERQDPLDKALALRDWVSRRCVYSLAPPPIPDEDDHVRVFLRDERRGYCDMFASSLAILCRTAGIPARLATGFAPGDPSGDGFNLRAEDKHAWTEVYFPGTGWVVLDATAGAATDGSVPRTGGQKGSWLRRLRAGLGARWGLVAPLLAGIALILGYVLKTEVYDRWRARRPNSSRPLSTFLSAPRSPLGHRYARLARALARLGLGRRPSETPDEHAARVAPLLPALEAEGGGAFSRPLVLSLTAAFTQACYGRPDSPLGGPEKWDEALGRFEAASWRVLGLRLWRRITEFRPSPGARQG